MEHYEMAELLSAKAGVTLAEAREVLIQCDWDMLDAMVELERRGGMKLVDVQVGRSAGDGAGPRRVKNAAGREPILTNGFAQMWHYIKRFFILLGETTFVVIRREKEVLSVPVIVPAILLVCCFWLTLPALVGAMFFGCKYQFRGKKAAEAANKAMDKLGGVVDSIRETLDNE